MLQRPRSIHLVTHQCGYGRHGALDALLVEPFPAAVAYSGCGTLYQSTNAIVLMAYPSLAYWLLGLSALSPVKTFQVAPGVNALGHCVTATVLAVVALWAVRYLKAYLNPCVNIVFGPLSIYVRTGLLLSLSYIQICMHLPSLSHTLSTYTLPQPGPLWPADGASSSASASRCRGALPPAAASSSSTPMPQSPCLTLRHRRRGNAERDSARQTDAHV